MKFAELKNSLRSNVENVYLLSGVDEFLLSSAYNLILKYSNLEVLDLNLIKFNEGIIDLDDVVRASNTMPVFSDKKVVYLDIRMSKKTEIKNIKSLNDYLSSPNPQCVLIINIGDSEVNFGIDKKNVVEVDCGRLDYKLVTLKIKSIVEKLGKSISDDATEELFNYTLGDLSRISVEVDKLIGFIGDKDEIEKVDIVEMVTPSLEYKIFELTDALSKKDAGKAYKILEDMKSRKEEYRTLPALIYAHFRRLFLISITRNLTNAEIANYLGVKEYAVKMSVSQVKLFAKSQLKRINDLCVDMDIKLKNSDVSIENAIELIVLTILNM